VSKVTDFLENSGFSSESQPSVSEFKSHRPDHLNNIENIGESEDSNNPNSANVENVPKDSTNISGALEGANEQQVKFPKCLTASGRLLMVMIRSASF